MNTMYQAKINSPSTTLADGIDSLTTSISVADSSVLPPAPNLLIIGSGEDAETCRYTNITGNTVTVERGFQGVAKSWSLGEVIARNYTAYDHDTFIENILEATNTINSNPTGITGADQITNIVSLTQSEYDAITPNSSTLYIIT